VIVGDEPPEPLPGQRQIRAGKATANPE